jgi:hypothetical protein
VVHYFGFHQRLELAQDLCKEEGIVLIEDCAHCFYGDDRGTPIGSRGDCAAPLKFFRLRRRVLGFEERSILERSPNEGPPFQLKVPSGAGPLARLREAARR